MHRPRVLHVARDWVRPSEGFVADVVATTSATDRFVAFGHPGGSPPTVPSRQLRPGSDRALRMQLAALAVTQRSEVLHAHFGYWASHAETVARRLHLPWAVSLHGHDLLVEGCPSAVHADLVVVPSQYLADAASRAGVRDGRIRVIPSGLDLSRHAFRERVGHEGPVLVTFAGRFVEKKGVLDAARAMAGVEGIRCRFVGTGPLERELRILLAELRLDAEVIDGSVAGAVHDALQSTDLLLTASKVASDGDAETLGLVNLEAHACGVPVITTRSGGIPEAVSPDAAVLVPEGDVAALRAALVDLVDSPQSWPARGRAGRAHVVLRHELGSRVADLEEQWRALAARTALPQVATARTVLPKVSIVMVTSGRRDLASRALDAIAAQTYPAELTEVLVVDNASIDGTAHDLADRPVTVLREAQHAPVAAARNRAFARASGEVVVFTDDDCRPTPTWVEALVAGLREEVGLVQGRTLPDPEQEVRALSRTQWTPSEAGLYETCNIAYTAGAFAGVGGFDENFAGEVEAVLGPRFGRYPFGEDTDLAWRAKRTGVLSRFASTSVVHHHVFGPDPSYLMRRSVVGAAWPLLLKRVPEIDDLLTLGVILGPHRRRVLLAAGGLAVAAAQPVALVAVVPWVWRATKPLQRGRKDRLRALPVLAARDAVATVALVYGSVRARRLVL